MTLPRDAARVAPKSSNHPNTPPQNVSWGKNQHLDQMKKAVIEQIAKEKSQLRVKEETGLKIALESVSPRTAEGVKMLKMSKEAQARLISRLIQTQLMGEFLTLQREQVNWRDLVQKTESDPLVMSAASVMADHVVGAGIYVTADDPTAKSLVENWFENVGGDETGGMESLLRECSMDTHLYGLHLWQKYYQPANADMPLDLRIVPLESIYRVHRDDKGNWVTMHQMPEYYGEPVDAKRRLVIFKFRAINQNAYGAGVAQLMYITRTYTLSIRDNTTGRTLSSRTIVVPSQFDGRSMFYDIMLKVFQRYGMPYQALVVGDKDNKADQNIVENLVKPAWKRRDEIAINKPLAIVGDEIDPRTRFEAYINEMTNLNIVTTQTPILKLWAAPEGMTEASARTALKAFDRIVLYRQRFLKRILERKLIPEFLTLNGIDPIRANVRIHFGPIDKPELSFQDLIGIFNLNAMAIQMANIEDPPQFDSPLKPAPKKPGTEAFPPPGQQPPMMGTPKPRKIKWVMSIGEFRANLRRYGFDLEEQMEGEQLAEPAANPGKKGDDDTA